MQNLHLKEKFNSAKWFVKNHLTSIALVGILGTLGVGITCKIMEASKNHHTRVSQFKAEAEKIIGNMCINPDKIDEIILLRPQRLHWPINVKIRMGKFNVSHETLIGSNNGKHGMRLSASFNGNELEDSFETKGTRLCTPEELKE